MCNGLWLYLHRGVCMCVCVLCQIYTLLVTLGIAITTGSFCGLLMRLMPVNEVGSSVHVCKA